MVCKEEGRMQTNLLVAVAFKLCRTCFGHILLFLFHYLNEFALLVQ